MHTWGDVRNFASQKFHLTPAPGPFLDTNGFAKFTEN